MAADFDIMVHEVGPRDGLQATEIVMATDAKIRWIKALKQAQVRKIQVGSFVSPKLLPQLADTPKIVKAAQKIGGFAISVLVPNLKGAKFALEAGVDQINFVMSASEAHNFNNVRKSHEESLAEFGEIVKLRNSEDRFKEIEINAGISTAFGCTISGHVSPKMVYGIADSYLKLGAERLSVSDTVGYANPRQVKEIMSEVQRIAGNKVVCGHFHDTRGMGLANAVAAVEVGVVELDGCLGGIGGCPFAPNATGNVVTEDLVFMLEAMGLKTGICLDKLMLARKIMEDNLEGEPTYGAYSKAGPLMGFY